MQLLVDNKSEAKRPIIVSRAGDVANVYMRGIIYEGEGIDAADVLEAVNKAGDAKTIVFNIHTPGGSVFEGREIMDIIRNVEAKTVAHIGSLCASAGTSIALACNEVEMSDGAYFMIHNAQGVVAGDKTQLRKAADNMEKIELAIVNDYTQKTGKTSDEVSSMMNETTWMTAKEALEHGFIDRIASAPKTKNTFNIASLEKVPEELSNEDKEPPPIEDKPAEQEPADAGFFMSVANENRLRIAQIV